jgi:hypothetical protein
MGDTNSLNNLGYTEQYLPHIEDSLCDEDIDILEDEFVDRVVLKEEDTPFSPFPLYPKFLKSFISHKLRPVKSVTSPVKFSDTSSSSEEKK